ncbi:tripartite tricarboxylate transporter substrate binding protein [Microbacterium pseudoresistens]|uniref:Tripartite-type tricarboxylate transporter receptor subunit TctC n=1 Tax=Microbacterium pseudoresistens TaxID=640634 RepID=A0A7Y9EV33_9MICO|nr:tripartite tricarboxylate transporter substrate binding protein [Microbacterium pseudoresistens]NYD54364.1 tripartite-type tricarboxylate transporter receptor subunit TctC [Microbacterium pseudoresistens]
MKKKRIITALAVATVAAIGLAGCSGNGGSAAEEDYPTSSIDITVPFAPGGATDTFARMIAEYAESEGHQATVLNKEGAGGIVGTQAVLNSKPDGYSIAATAASSSLLNFTIGTDVPYDPEDFTYISRVLLTPLALVVPGDSPYQNVRELLDAVKKNPGNFSFGTSAAGGPSTFGLGELLISEGIDPSELKMVIFNGGAPTVTAVAGAQVDFAAQLAPEVMQLTKDGTIRALAISSDRPIAGLDAPTNEEAGVPAFSHQSVSGLAGPADLPPNVVEFWQDLIQKALDDPEFQKKVEEQLGAQPAYLSGADYLEWNLDQIKTYTELAAQLNITE